jgi:branched-chain amino acid transport system ATP-binding protein
VRHVMRNFGGVKAVNDVSFVAAIDAITGLIGPNGAGKTTMFNLLAGNLKPSSGEIYFRGQRIDRHRSSRRVSLGLARTFQIPRPFAAMSVLENVVVAAPKQEGERFWANWTWPSRVAQQEKTNIEKARALLDFLTLGHLALEAARVLSGGQRKLLELARVLMTEPAMILLDEPAAGVNPNLLETIIDRIQALAARGTGFLVIEHNMDVIARLCPHVMVMAGGQVLCQGSPDEVTGDPRVIEAYLGKPAP